MSAASSLLRRRSLRAFTSLLEYRQRELEYLTGTTRGSHHGFRNFATIERLAPSLSPRALVQDRKSLGASCGVYRRFGTDADNGPTSPGPSPQASTIGTGTKVTAVAISVAALSWAVAYLAFDMKPSELSTYFSQPIKEEQQEPVAREGQAPESHVIGHQSDGNDRGGRPSTEAKSEVSEVKPKVREESNSVLQVIKGTPLTPKAIEDFQLEPHGAVDSGFQIKEIENVKSSPHMTVGNEGSEGSQQSMEENTKADIRGNNSTKADVLEVNEDVGQFHPHDTVSVANEKVVQYLPSAFSIDIVTEVKEEVGQSHPHDTVTEVKEEFVQSLPSAFVLDSVTDVKEEVAQSHPHDTVTEANPETIRSDGAAGQSDFSVDTSENFFANTNLKDIEPDTFRKEMQETAKEEDLKEFSDKFLYNHTSGEKDEKKAVCSVDAADDLRNVVAETLEVVADLTQEGFEGIQIVKIEALQPDVPDVKSIPGIAEAYFLTEANIKESEESRVQEFESDRLSTYAGAIEDLEKRQAEADAQFREMLLKLDEEYQQELREARKQQELQAEYANKLKKDLGVEKVRWEEEARQQLEAAEERLRNELKRKEEEGRKELEKMELLSQARTNAAVAAEKARQLQETKELQLQIEALHRAYNAQSEGARVSHTTHKLAMGAFAFEDAMARGTPLVEEVELLKQAAGGYDELIDIALQSLPEDVLIKGTKTQIQLEREFASLQGPLRQLALIPAGQGGLLTHAVASAVAAMKVRESSGREGVESVIATVEECFANGELSQAANILEQGVKGSRAEPFVSDWTRHVRARVIAEQALTLVQAHAIATAAGLA